MDPTTDRRYINNGGLTIKQMVDSFNSNKNESKEFKIPSYSFLAKVMEAMKSSTKYAMQGKVEVDEFVVGAKNEA